MTAATRHPEVEPMTAEARPDDQPAPDEVDPEHGTDPEGTPVENPGGRAQYDRRFDRSGGWMSIPNS